MVRPGVEVVATEAGAKAQPQAANAQGAAAPAAPAKQ